jgi:GT2 family glycosyltransferase
MQAPLLVSELELAEPITDVRLPARGDGVPYNGVHLLVRMQHTPVGYVFLAPDELSAAEVCGRVWRQLGSTVNERRTQAGLPALDALLADGIPAEPALDAEWGDDPLVSVVVCTRNRPDSVLVTLRGLADLRYAPFEVVLVDNAPSSDATKDAVAREFGDDPRFRYVRELRPGLSCARNRGLVEASADIVAFTDDDVQVDEWWLNGMVRGFRAVSDVACVTGLIATAEIDNAAQLYFHLREGWGANVERRIFDLGDNRDDSPLYPYSAGIFGAGANFAVSRMALKEVGGFNEALGAGMPSGGGEDLNMFMRIVLSGHRLVYEPSAMVKHFHRTDLGELSRQMRAYGSGCTAALTAIFLDSPRARRELPLKVLAGMARMRNLSKSVRENEALPSGLIRREIVGFLIGPGLYLKGKRDLRRLAAFRD